MSLRMLTENGVVPMYNEPFDIKNYESYHIPILYLSGNLTGMTKEDAVSLSYVYGDRSGSCTLKWQGASSLNLPKKNYTIKFDTEFEAVSGWGAQKKYVLKANFVDSSHARNICCAKLWGQIAKTRSNATLNALPNGGAVDGFPIVLSINGRFMGLYTFNIPKDGWMLGMSGTAQKQAIVCAENNNNGAVAFKGLATLAEDSNGQLDFDLEYSSDDQSDWVVTSLNRLIGAVMNSDGTNIEYGITPYLDWDSAIDYYIHAVLTGNYDGVHRNYLLYTHDGVKWAFEPYDMDVVLGLRAMGRYFYPVDATSVQFWEMANNHRLFKLIWTYMRPQLRARYNALRAEAMSVYNVSDVFTNFACKIPLSLYVADNNRWEVIPSSGANNMAQIVSWYDFRCRLADEWIKSTSGETAMPEQVDPNIYAVTNTLTNCATSNNAATVEKNGAYTATITANSGYELSSVVVKMGGVDITSTAYSNGVITISSVTGDIVITASATAKPAYTYTNQVPISKDENGNVFNGKGWIGNTRLSSSGTTKDGRYSSTTGYIPATSGAVIRTKGVKFNSGSEYICVYDSTFALLGYISGVSHSTEIGTATCDGDLTVTTLASNSNIAWIRVSLHHNNGDDAGYATVADPLEGPGSYMIVTVNEEIT